MSPKTTGAESTRTTLRARVELFLVDGNNLAYRAFFAAEELATSEASPTNGSASRTCFQALRLPAEKGRGRLGHPSVHRHAQAEAGRGRLQGGPLAHAGPAAGVPHFRPIVAAFGYGTSSRGPGGRRRDRDARDAQTRRIRTSSDRPRRVPARLENVCLMMSAARRRRRQRLHAGARQAPWIRRQIPDFIGSTRHSDNIPGVPGIGDKTAAPRRAVRVARGRAGARRGVVAGAEEEPDRVRRSGARRECARDDATRSRHRGRSGRARSCAAGPRAAARDVPAVRVPRAARARRRARRGRARARADLRRHGGRVARG